MPTRTLFRHPQTHRHHIAASCCERRYHITTPHHYFITLLTIPYHSSNSLSLFLLEYTTIPRMSSSSSSSDNDNKSPTEKESWNDRVNRFLATGHAHLHASVAAMVDGMNQGLAGAEKTAKKVQAPVNQAWQQASAWEQKVEAQMNVLYQKRDEIGPQVVAGSAVAGGLLSLIRKRSIFRLMGGAVLTGGLAYIVTYEPIPIKRIPDMIMDQFQLRKQGEEKSK